MQVNRVIKDCEHMSMTCQRYDVLALTHRLDQVALLEYSRASCVGINRYVAQAMPLEVGDTVGKDQLHKGAWYDPHLPSV